MQLLRAAATLRVKTRIGEAAVKYAGPHHSGEKCNVAFVVHRECDVKMDIIFIGTIIMIIIYYNPNDIGFINLAGEYNLAVCLLVTSIFIHRIYYGRINTVYQ
ncbi:hypothetical protein [Sodalis praecaptivus]|uniref:hypothetical protein n=1 Tax=Sodalis praecaptivus TaxID=1239307 RepID=UPI00280A6ECA|nr:hypothetical protein [Sodalis praecaptivus]